MTKRAFSNDDPDPITEIIALGPNNRYQIWERMDRRQKSTWDCAEVGQGFHGTTDQLLKYLHKRQVEIIGKLYRSKLRVETAPQEDNL